MFSIFSTSAIAFFCCLLTIPGSRCYLRMLLISVNQNEADLKGILDGFMAWLLHVLRAVSWTLEA